MKVYEIINNLKETMDESVFVEHYIAISTEDNIVELTSYDNGISCGLLLSPSTDADDPEKDTFEVTFMLFGKANPELTSIGHFASRMMAARRDIHSKMNDWTNEVEYEYTPEYAKKDAYHATLIFTLEFYVE